MKSQWERDISTAVSNNLQAELAQTQPQKGAKCSTAVFPKIFTFREEQSQFSPVSR
jgi:hypothetical protein